MKFLNTVFHGNYTESIINLYRRNKIFLITSAAIFFLSILIGIITGYFLPETTGHYLTLQVKELGSHVEKTTLSIFLNNFKAALLIYAGGLVGIITAGILSVNGFLYGAFLGYFAHGGILSHYGVDTPKDFLIYTVPHGIIEIPALIISGAAGFRLTSAIFGLIKSIIRKKPADEHYWKLKDSLALLVIAVILLFIAAIIEANITPTLGNYITGLNIH